VSGLRRAAPLVAEASRTYKIPLVRHDFPLPMHPWAYDAAVLAAISTLVRARSETSSRHRLRTSWKSRKIVAAVCREVAAAHQDRFAFCD